MTLNSSRICGASSSPSSSDIVTQGYPHCSVADIYSLLSKVGSLGAIQSAMRYQQRHMTDGCTVLFIGSGHCEDVRMAIEESHASFICCIEASPAICDTLRKRYTSHVASGRVRVRCERLRSPREDETERYDVVVVNCFFNMFQGAALQNAVIAANAWRRRPFGIMTIVDFRADLPACQAYHFVAVWFFAILTWQPYHTAAGKMPDLPKYIPAALDHNLNLMERQRYGAYQYLCFGSQRHWRGRLSNLLQTVGRCHASFAAVGCPEREVSHIWIRDEQDGTPVGALGYCELGRRYWCAVHDPLCHSHDLPRLVQASERAASLVGRTLIFLQASSSTADYLAQPLSLFSSRCAEEKHTRRGYMKLRWASFRLHKLSTFHPNGKDRSTLNRMGKHYYVEESSKYGRMFTPEEELLFDDLLLYNSSQRHMVKLIAPRPVHEPGVTRKWVCRERCSGCLVAMCVAEPFAGKGWVFTSYVQAGAAARGSPNGALDMLILSVVKILKEECPDSQISFSFNFDHDKVSMPHLGGLQRNLAEKTLAHLSDFLYHDRGIVKKKRQWERSFEKGQESSCQVEDVYALLPVSDTLPRLWSLALPVLEAITVSGFSFWPILVHRRRQRRTVLVIGANYYGLVAADTAFRRGEKVVIMDNGAGFENPSKHCKNTPAALYLAPLQGLTLQLSSWLEQADVDKRVTSLQEFALRSGLYHRIRFDVVADALQAENGLVRVTYHRAGDQNRTWNGTYDRVVVCSEGGTPIISTELQSEQGLYRQVVHAAGHVSYILRYLGISTCNIMMVRAKRTAGEVPASLNWSGLALLRIGDLLAVMYAQVLFLLFLLAQCMAAICAEGTRKIRARVDRGAITIVKTNCQPEEKLH